MGAILKTPFTEAQVEILKLFTTDLTDVQMEELRQLLIAFKFKLLDEHIENVSAKKGLTDDDIEKVSFEHRRTTYRHRLKQDNAA